MLFEDIRTIENDHERLIILRKRLEKSQYQFAKELGISSSYLGQIENRKYPVTDKLRRRINEYLKREQEQESNAENIFSNI